MRTMELTHAYLIHTREFRETSLLIDFFTRDYGYIRTVAKGVRSYNKNNKRGMLRPFTKLLINWGGHSDLVNLQNIELAAPPLILTSSSMAIVFYLNELLYYILSKYTGMPMPELWQDYADLLDYIKSSENKLHNKVSSSSPYAQQLNCGVDVKQQGQEMKQVQQKLEQSLAIEIRLRDFELNLLDYIGYGLQFDGIEPNLEYAYNFESGFYALNNTASADSGFNSKSKILAIPGEILLELESRNWHNKEVFLAAKKLLRLIIKYHIGDKEFYSRKLYYIED